jgi:formylmethanofuran dehydrogenase subunit B
MGDARIDGRAVTLEAAIAKAAKLLAASRLPVIAGLGTDIAGARAAIALAERVGGVIDHMHSDALLRDLAVMREAGAYMTTPNEARLRGDTLLLVGPGLMEAWPEMGDRLLFAPLAPQAGEERRIFWLCPGKGAALPASAEVVGRNAGELPTLLALVRAHLGGRLAKAPKAVADLAKALRTARFGVAVWSAASLDELTIEMLFGLLDDLNAGTRFTGLPLTPGDNAAGVLQTCGWMTGFPPRTGFARAYPEHDPWRFDVRRMIQNGEADCALWISAYGVTDPAWRASVPTITLAGEPASYSAVYIQVGRPALDHDSVEHNQVTGTLVARSASQRSDLPSAAEVMKRIAAALPGASPC